MATMDDLIATISGGMHVSQDGYDLKALQEYLSKTIILPTLATSPVDAFHPLPPSRSTSSTRRPQSFPSSYFPDTTDPSQTPNASNLPSNFAGDVAMVTPASRPTSLRRTSSYGFGTLSNQPVTPGSSTDFNHDGFEGDAFAPLWEDTTHHQDPWARIRAQPDQAAKPNPWGAFTGQPSSFSAHQPQHPTADRNHQNSDDRPPTPPDENEEMDEDMADIDMAMDEGEEEEQVERAMGAEREHSEQYAICERGRRKS